MPVTDLHSGHVPNYGLGRSIPEVPSRHYLPIQEPHAFDMGEESYDLSPPGEISFYPDDPDFQPVTSKKNLVHRNNSVITFASVPLLWTALSLALGVEVKGELVKGLPCITRFNQLFCRSGGTSYPAEEIEKFINDNKALIRRMHGELSVSPGRRKRATEDFSLPGDDYVSYQFDSNEKTFNLTTEEHLRLRRQVVPGPLPKTDRIDACESEEEVTTPYWASNSRGKILAIVNTNEFSQIIHKEICTKQTTKRCNGDCGCEQKYKYHRLMAYDPENDCKGIFMDWFLFPSCCSCRCDPL